MFPLSLTNGSSGVSRALLREGWLFLSEGRVWRLPARLVRAAILLAGLMGLAWIFHAHMATRRQQTQAQAAKVAADLRQQIDMVVALAELARQQMQINLRDARWPGLEPGLDSTVLRTLRSWRQGPQHEVYSLPLHPDLPGALSGRVTPRGQSAAGVLASLDAETLREIRAALRLSLTPYRDDAGMPRYVWFYYTSARQFIYIAPKVAPERFVWHPELYELPYWTSAIPENNPVRKVVMSRLYEDSAGMGHVITVSAPVWLDQVFRGVVSLDLGIERLGHALPVGGAGEWFLVDEHGQIVVSSRPFKLGDTLPGSSAVLRQAWLAPSEVVHYNDSDHYVQAVMSGELFLVHRMDRPTFTLTVLRDMSLPGGILLLLILVLLLLTWLARSLALARRLSTQDSLTRLLNRRAVQAQCETFFAYADRYGDATSLLSLDIDHFKLINDRYGHAVGDAAIVMVADILRAATRKADLVARQGGEEFLLVLPGVGLDGARQLAEKLRTTIEAASYAPGQHLTVSLGCVQRERGESYDAVLNRADALLYQAKHHGRNRVEWGAIRKEA